MYPKRKPTHLAHAIPHRQSLVCIAATSGAPTLSEKLAWCAGIFDGDGSIGISRQHLPGRKNPTYRLVLSLVQNCDVTIRKFRDYLAVPHCLVEVKRSARHNRQIYDLRYDGRHAMAVLALIHPHLVRKRIEAEVADDFWHICAMGLLPGCGGLTKEVWTDRAYFYDKMQALK